MALMPSAASHDAPAAAAPTPQTNPNGVSPTHAGSISANPARKSEEASSRRIDGGLSRAGNAPAEAVRGRRCYGISPVPLSRRVWQNPPKRSEPEGRKPMDMPVNHFKRALRDGKRVFGAWLVSGAPSTAEALGCAGFDFLVVDMEHTPVDTPEMVEILRTIAGTPAQAVVRLVWNDMVWVKRVLDGGAQTLLLPFVQNADEAKRAVAYTRYPPDGIRGVAGGHRGSRFGTVPDYLKTAAQEICVMVQIETQTALANLAAIAAVPGIDSIFIGPSDLAASMGFLGDLTNPAVQEKLKSAAAAMPAARQILRHPRHEPGNGRDSSSAMATTGSPSAPTWLSWSDARRNGWARPGPKLAPVRALHERIAFRMRARHQGKPR